MLAPIVKDDMTTNEKKHFILQHLSLDQFNGRSADTSQLALCVSPPLTVSEVNVLCRDMEYEVPLKIYSHKDSGETLDILQTQNAIDAFKTGKYLLLNSIDNIEFEILNFLYNKSTSTRTRINHILVSSSMTVFETTEILKNMVEANLIQMQPQPLELRYTNDNELIDNHVLAFESIHRPIKANITIQGKAYFKQQYMDNDKPHQTFNGPTNFIGGDNHGRQTLLTNQTNTDQQVEKKKLINKIWNLISENKLLTGIILLIVAAVINSISNSKKSPNNINVNSNKSDTVLKTP
jgi:hypothetical protein